MAARTNVELARAPSSGVMRVILFRSHVQGFLKHAPRFTASRPGKGNVW